MNNVQFPHTYEWEILPGVPPGRKYMSFMSVPTLNTFGDSIEFLVEVIPYQGETWIGNFGGTGLHFPSSVFYTPREDFIGVNSEGAVYFVNVFSPQEYVEIPIIPAIKILPVYDADLLLMVGFTQVAAYDKSGLRWAKKVSADGIEIKEVTQQKVIGLAWSPPKNRYVNFEIDIATGEVTGGSSFM